MVVGVGAVEVNVVVFVVVVNRTWVDWSVVVAVLVCVIVMVVLTMMVEVTVVVPDGMVDIRVETPLIVEVVVAVVVTNFVEAGWVVMKQLQAELAMLTAIEQSFDGHLGWEPPTVEYPRFTTTFEA